MNSYIWRCFMQLKKKETRQSIYRTSLFFTLIYFVVIYYQKRILTGLFQTQLSFSIPDILAVLTSENKLDTFINRATNGTIVVGIFLALEVLLFVVFIIYLLVKIFFLYKRKKLQKHDFLLITGLIILLFGSFYYSYITASHTIQSLTEVQQILERLSPKQLKALSEQWSTFFYEYNFSALNFMKDYTVIADQVAITFGNVKALGRIPNILHLWLDNLNLLKNHYFIVMCIGFISTLLAQLFNRYLNGPLFRRRKDVDAIIAENDALKKEISSLKRSEQSSKTKKRTTKKKPKKKPKKEH